MESKAFRNLDEFRSYASGFRLLCFHVFRGVPDDAMMKSLPPLEDGEQFILLNANEDQGFLTTTPVTVEITSDRHFLSRPLLELTGIGTWGKGTLYGFSSDHNYINEMVEKARKFATPRRD